MKEENARELRGAIAKVIEAMANDGDKEMKFAYEHTQIDNKQWAIFKHYADMRMERKATEEITDRYVEFYIQISKLYDEFMKAEGIEC